MQMDDTQFMTFTKCHKSKYFFLIFHSVNIIGMKIFQFELIFQLCNQNNDVYDF